MSRNSPDPPTGHFLFVNKDPSSETLSHSTTREVAAAINSHAQRWTLESASSQRARSEQRPQVPIKAKILPLEAYMSKIRVNQLQDDGTTRQRRRSVKKTPSSAALKRSFKKSPPSKQLSTPTQQQSLSPISFVEQASDDTQSSLIPLPLLLTTNYIPGACIDPFRVTVLPMDADVQPVISYYLGFALTSTSTPSAAYIDHSTAIQAIVSGSLSNSTHMYALLAATAARMRHVSNVTFRPSASPEFFLQCAIQSLRDTLSALSSVVEDRQTVLDIFYLSICEWYLQSHNSARMHFSFLRHFWHSLHPDASVLDRYIHDMISFNDVFLSIETASPPFIELSWEPEPLSWTNVKLIKEVINPLPPPSEPWLLSPSEDYRPQQLLSPPPHGSGFLSIIDRNLVGHETGSVLREIPLLLDVYHYTLTFSNATSRTATPASFAPTPILSPAPDPAEAISTYLSTKAQAMLHRLMSTPTFGSELCCRLALIILLSSLSSSVALRQGKVDMLKLAKRLHRQLEYEMPSHNLSGAGPVWTGKDENMLLWILLTGLFACSGDAEEEAWFEGKSVELTTGLGLGLWQVEAVLTTFLYLPPLQARVVEGWYRSCAQPCQES